MSLIQCNECRNKISDKATTCPKCGCPIQSKKVKRKINFKNIKKIIKNEPKKLVKIISVSLIIISIIICLILFMIYKIPSKYCGTYVDYFYAKGSTYKTTYIISPFSIKSKSELYTNSEKKIESKKYKYKKIGKDIVVDDEYFIVEDDKLFIHSSKDISSLKEYEIFSWNIKSKKSDIYEMNFEAQKFVDILESSVDNWSRELIYKTNNHEMDDYGFYILDSDKHSDESDLKEYSVNYEAAGGNLEIVFDRKAKKINSIHYSANVSVSMYSNDFSDSATPEDIIDSRAMLLSAMAIISSKDEYVDSISNNSDDNFENITFHTIAAFDYDDLMENLTMQNDDDRLFSLDNERYKVSYKDTLTIGATFTFGHVYWNIYIK